MHLGQLVPINHPILSDTTKPMTIINRLVLEDVYGDVLAKKDDVDLRTHYTDLFEQQANALCLSGGGIRSGTFALGVLQGLANSNQIVTG